MGRFVDFAELKKRVCIEQVARMLGLKTKQEGDRLRAPCPACQKGDDRTLVITPTKEVFYCHAMGMGGDLIRLAAHVREESLPDAAGWIQDQLGNPTSTVSSNTSTVTSSNVPAAQPLTSKHDFDPSETWVEPPKGWRPPEKKSHHFDRAKYQAGLDRTHELLKDIPQDFIERADIGVSNRGALRGIVLPAYDKDTGEFLCYVKVEGIELPKATVTRLKTA